MGGSLSNSRDTNFFASTKYPGVHGKLDVTFPAAPSCERSSFNNNQSFEIEVTMTYEGLYKRGSFMTFTMPCCPRPSLKPSSSSTPGFSGQTILPSGQILSFECQEIRTGTSDEGKVIYVGTYTSSNPSDQGEIQILRGLASR